MKWFSLEQKMQNNISLVDEGNADWVWQRAQKATVFPCSGRKDKIYRLHHQYQYSKTYAHKNDSYGNYEVSPKGNYVYWYNPALKNYFTYNVATGKINQHYRKN
jgi:hypothetical protein